MDLGAVRCDCLCNFYHDLPVSGWETMCHKCRNLDCFQNPLGFEDVPMVDSVCAHSVLFFS